MKETLLGIGFVALSKPNSVSVEVGHQPSDKCIYHILNLVFVRAAFHDQLASSKGRYYAFDV